MKRLVLTLVLMFASAFTAYEYKHWFEHYNTGIMFPYSNGALHEWACNAVYEFKPNDKGGCYDICLGFMNKDAVKYKDNPPLAGLTDDWPVHIQNACAITLNGAEW